MGTAVVRKGALPQPLQLGFLVGANLLASIAGGKVLSAAEGVTGIAVLGSGSLLALLLGSALGLGLLLASRRFLGHWALVGLSLATVFSSLTLMAILWSDKLAQHVGTTIWQGSHHTLAQPEAWLFFLALIVRCGLWFAGRSMRSDRAGSLHPAWLAFTEMAYFLGFIVGLLIGPLSVAGQGNLASTLFLDVLLLNVVTAGDFFGGRMAPLRYAAAMQQSAGELTPSRPFSFWPLTAAFGASTVACQVVVLHVADVLAQTRQTSWSNLTLAAFYLGVALAAALCTRAHPVLEVAKAWRVGLVMRAGRRVVRISLLPLIMCIGMLTLGGIAGIVTATQAGTVLAPWSMVGILALAAVGSGAGLFEMLVLALLGSLRTRGSGSVALAFGIVATIAAIALFLMMLGNLRVIGWVVTSALGLALTVWIVREASHIQVKRG